MTKKKKVIKPKEPVRIRCKELANGNKSIYLDIYTGGKRTYEFLKLYLVPEVDAAARMQNQNTLQAANAIKAKRLIALANDAAGIKTKAAQSKILLLDWFAVFQQKQAERGTKMAAMLNAFPPALIAFGAEKTMLKDVDKSFCLNFIHFVSKEYISPRTKTALSAATASRFCSYLNRTLKEAVKAELIDKNPYDLIEAADKVKVPESQREYLTTDEIKRLINTPCCNDCTKRAFLFSCFCGLRISDVRDLTWGSIFKDGEQYRAEVVMQKTKAPIYLPLSDEAMRWLPERGSAADTDKVFSLCELPTIEKHLRNWAAAAAITKHVTFHTSRHTFATLMLTLGADLYTTSKLLGHAEIATTQIYAKIVNKKKDEAVNLVNGIFSK